MAKSTKPTIRIHNTETDEVIDREMTDAEYAEYVADQANQVIKQSETDAKETAKSAILDRLGLTADELKTILG
jgi:hypothetical protein